MAGDAEPAFRAGLELLQRGDHAAAFATLEDAAARGSRDAALVLGQGYLHGKVVPPDPARAIAHLERAAATPWGPPEMLLAAVLRIGHGVDADDARAAHWFARALEAGHAPAWRTAGLLRATRGDAAGARALLGRARDSGDLFAKHALALLDAVQGDAAAAQRVFALSPLPISQRRRGGGASAAWAVDGPAWSPDSGRAPWSDPPLRGPRTRLNETPRVEVQDPGLSPWECDYLMTVTAPNLQPSKTLDSNDGSSFGDPARTSWDCSLRGLIPDLVVADIGLAMAGLAGLPLSRSESLALLRYGVGQEYKEHYDFFSPAMLETPRFRTQGQRVLTVIAYLNEVERGGTTAFPRLNLRVPPAAGRMLRFDNVLADGGGDARALHCGDPVESGDKWIVTAWFRERPATEYAFGQIPGRSA